MQKKFFILTKVLAYKLIRVFVGEIVYSIKYLKRGKKENNEKSKKSEILY